MPKQIAVRIDEGQLEALDRAIGAGVFESRADGVRQGLERLLREQREQEIAREYREAYARHPDDPALGEAGAELLADAFRREEGQTS